MKKWIMLIALFGLLLSTYSTESQVVLVWTEKGCEASYKPGESVKIHYKVYDAGWTKVHKQYPDTHKEELFGWRYFPSAGEFVEIDKLGPECGRITYTVSFWQEVPSTYTGCLPCNACSPFPIYVMETGRHMCAITVVCDMKASLFTDKTEYIAGVDPGAQITVNITDVYGDPLDADSVILDVNGESVTAVQSFPGLYTASFTLSGRKQGEYTVTANIFKRDYPQVVKTAQFSLVVPVTIQLSTDRKEYTVSFAVVRADVKDVTGRGVSGLQFDVIVSDVQVPVTDVGGGIYEARIDLSGVDQGEYTVDISDMGAYVVVDSVLKAVFTVSGLPLIVVGVCDPVEVGVDSGKDVSVVIKNTGEGDAVDAHVLVEAPPGVDVTRVSGYNSLIPAGGETTACISLTGREPGEYIVAVEVLCHDVGGGTTTGSGAFPVTVKSSVKLLLVAAIGVVAVGAAAYILSKTGAKAEKELKNGEQKAGEAAEKGAKTASEAAKKEEPQ